MIVPSGNSSAPCPGPVVSACTQEPSEWPAWRILTAEFVTCRPFSVPLQVPAAAYLTLSCCWVLVAGGEKTTLPCTEHEPAKLSTFSFAAAGTSPQAAN